MPCNTSSHLLCHKSPAKPSWGPSGRLLPGLRGTLLKRGFPRSRLPLELLLRLQGGFMQRGDVKGKRKTQNTEIMYQTKWHVTHSSFIQQQQWWHSPIPHEQPESSFDTLPSPLFSSSSFSSFSSSEPSPIILLSSSSFCLRAFSLNSVTVSSDSSSSSNSGPCKKKTKLNT